MFKLKIISGGQTGVDRAALDFALTNNYACGGYCPKGRLSESGKIPAKYPLTEIESSKYEDRTRKNVQESDGTMIIVDKINIGNGVKKTIEFCRQYSKPFYIINTDGLQNNEVQNFRDWVADSNILILNIAGNRESENLGIGIKTTKVLLRLFGC